MSAASVVISRTAEHDLQRIFGYIATESSVDIALAYRARLVEFLTQLEIFPNAGRALRSGDRQLGFERRMNIVYRVRPGRVTILRVAYAGQQLRGKAIS